MANKTRKQTKRMAVVSRRTEQLALDTVRVAGHLNPPDVPRTITVSYRCSFKITGGATGVSVLTPTNIFTKVPGGALAWARFRLIGLEVWGPANGLTNTATGGIETSNDTLTVNLNANGVVNFGEEESRFENSGVPGQRRAHVAIRPGLFTKAQWNPVTSAATLATITYPPYAAVPLTQGILVVHVTMQMVSVQPAAAT